MNIERLLNPCPAAHVVSAARPWFTVGPIPTVALLTPPPTMASLTARLPLEQAAPQPLQPPILSRATRVRPTSLSPLDYQKFRSAGCDDNDMVLLTRLMSHTNTLQDVLWLRRYLSFFKGLGFSAKQCLHVICCGTRTARVRLLSYGEELLQHGFTPAQLLILLQLRGASSFMSRMALTGGKILELGYDPGDLLELVSAGTGIAVMEEFLQQAGPAHSMSKPQRRARISIFLARRGRAGAKRS